MAHNEKFCLRWNDFESNINTAFQELRNDKDFFDVTLACDDEQIQAHKVILSACSPFFRNILRRNPHTHPLLYLKGVKYTDLQSVLSFMYHGEVNIKQEELNSFLAVAEDLRVKGLTQGQTESQQPNAMRNTESRPFAQKKVSNVHQTSKVRSLDVPQNSINSPYPPLSSMVSAPPSYNTSSSKRLDTEEIQELLPIKTEPREGVQNSLINGDESYKNNESCSLAQVEEDAYGYQDEQYPEYGQYEDHQDYGDSSGVVGSEQNNYSTTEGRKGQHFQDPSELFQFVRKDVNDKKYYCTLCEQFSHHGRNMARNHVESKHFPNTFSYPCDLCGEVLLSKSNFMTHRSRKHLNSK